MAYDPNNWWRTGNAGIDTERQKAGGYWDYSGGGGDSGGGVQPQWMTIGTGGTDTSGNWDPNVGRVGPGGQTNNAASTQGTADYFQNQYGTSLSGGLGASATSRAPTYDVSTQAGWDALQKQADVADYGKLTKGLAAVDPGWGQQSNYTGTMLKDLSGRIGFDANGYDTTTKEGTNSLYNALNDYGQKFVGLKALTGGWGGTGNAREAANTLYVNDNGTLRAVNDPTVSIAPEKGGWLAEHGAAKVGLLGLATVLTAGAAGLGAGAAGAGATSGAAGASGAAAGTGAAAGGTSLAGSVANAVGMGSQWAALSPIQQAMVTSAITNAASTGIQGGSLGDIAKSAIMGAATGGAGAYAGGALNSALGSQMPGWAAKGLTSAAVGGGLSALQGKNAAGGAIMGGLGSLISSGVGAAGGSNTLGQIASQAGKYGVGQYVQDAIKEDVSGQRQQMVQDIYQQAAQRGISADALNRFLQTPQGQAAMKAEFGKLGSSGTLQSLFA